MSAIVPAKRASASALVPAKRVREVKLVPPRRSSSQVLADRRADPAIAADLARPLTRDTMVARLSPVARLNHNRLIRQWNECYELYLEQNDGKNPLGFPPKLKVGMSMPEENEIEIICEFARYLTLVTEDHIDELARVNTLQHNVRTLFDVLHRLPYIVAQTTPLAVQSFIDSNCIRGITTTTTFATAARAKYYMSPDDAIIISRWENTDLFHTTRMRVQTHYKFLLQNLSLERSESMFQAARYKVSTNKKTDLAVAEAPPFLCWSAEPLGNIEYATILKTLSEEVGFPYPVTPNTCGTSNTMSNELSADDLRVMMGHTTMSSMFDDTFTGHLGAMLFNRPDNKEQNLKPASMGLLDVPKLT